MNQNSNKKAIAASAAMLALAGCMVGPKYQLPPAPTPVAYKEPPPEGWKEAQPNDGAIRGKWWELYNDPDLNALEEQVSISNQNVLAAEAQFRQARDAIRVARSALFPVVTAGTSAIDNRGANASGQSIGGVNNGLTFPSIGVSYTADVWGAIRRSIEASVDTAQASAAQLENARLLYQAELAQDYFSLHGLDGDAELLERTVKSYQQYLDLTKNRYAGGIASGGDVAQAETQLDTTQAQLIDLGVSRSQFEHAIAILTGKPPAALTIARKVLSTPPPAVPLALPSALLERRPDIAALERQMAASNEQIGIAQAAYYPTISLSASAGLQGSSLLNLFSWPARFWSIGPSLAETVFDAGRRSGQVKQAQDAFDVTVANYRANVLTAFQQVEDNLAALRIYEEEAKITALAVDAAERSLTIATDQYKAGTTSYLQVITTQAIALQNERTAIDLLTRRMTSSVLLIEALGGGWDASTLPSNKGLRAAGK
jgi:NodT family efflux transporter outer membrane factor (OMF) lipoprotein